jgi:formate hydrogenlyase subunit 4
MSSHDSENKGRKQYVFNLALAAVAGQVGCLTLVIVLLAVFIGLWLDSRFDTRPMMTLILVFGSLPVTLILMFAVVRGATKRMKFKNSSEEEENTKLKEERHFE